MAAYQRFIERNAHRLVPVPGALREMAVAEPADSPVRADVLAELDARRWKPHGMWLRRLHVPETDPNPALLRVIDVGSSVNAVAGFEQGGQSVLLVGCNDGMAYLYDARTGERIRSLSGHMGAISAVCALGEGRVVIGSDETARVWDVQSGRSLLELKGHTNRVHCGVRAERGSSDHRVG